MKKNFVAALLALALLSSVSLLQGCVQMPTEKQSVSDLRPQVSFRVPEAQRRTARVVVDGLDMGSVGSFLEGVAALRITSGTHQLRIVHGEQILLEESFYAGDGVNRTFIVQ